MGNIRDIFTFFFCLFCVIVFSFVLYLSLFNENLISKLIKILFLLIIIFNGVFIVFGFKDNQHWQIKFNKNISTIAVILLVIIWIILYFNK